MIPFEEALRQILAEARLMGEERAPLFQAGGRVLSRDVVADRDIPPHALSAMDGFACRRNDLSQKLHVSETIPAGSVPAFSVGPGQCSRIMTGAIVPQGADVVVMVENTRVDGDLVEVLQEDSRNNIRQKGEDVSKDDVVLEKGTFITPQVTAVLALVGCDEVPVMCRPRVAVVATGDELVEPSEKPTEAQIRNSNSAQLLHQILDAGCLPQYVGIAVDTPERIDCLLNKALNDADVVLLSGGVSMGDFDFVPGIMEKNGILLKFQKVAVKPGKPTVFGVREEKYFFGLPGNPVSTFVIFHVMVRPFLKALMGERACERRIEAQLSQEIRRKRTERHEFRPVRLLDAATVQPLEYHGSGHIHAYYQADGVIELAVGTSLLEKGKRVQVRLL